MIVVRKKSTRGHTRLSWLDSYHSFSFGAFQKPEYDGFSVLRVFNEHRVAASKGFATHGHRDIEILTFVLEGELAHEDGLGNHSVIRAGEVHRMSAGTGVLHNEYNPSDAAPVHFFQVWIAPEKEDTALDYAQRAFDADAMINQFCLIASRDGTNASLSLQQDVEAHMTIMDAGKVARCQLSPGRKAWVYVAEGAVRLNNFMLEAGDAAAVSDEKSMLFECSSRARIFLFDLP